MPTPPSDEPVEGGDQAAASQPGVGSAVLPPRRQEVRRLQDGVGADLGR